MRASCRVSLFVALLSASACAAAADRIYRSSFENPVDCIATPTNPECPTFTIATPVATVPPGEVQSTCYYFRSPNTATVGLRRIESTIAGSAWYVVVYATYDAAGQNIAERRPPGSFTSAECGFEFQTNNTTARRIYQAHATTESLDMPSNDGTGKPVAIELQPNQPLFVQIVAPNVTTDPITASVTLGFDAVPTGVPYTRTETYMAYRAIFVLPPNVTTSTTAGCSTPPGAKFWHFTTHTHRYATLATLGTAPTVTTIVSSDDWNAPQIKEFLQPPFYSFDIVPQQQLRYSCTYMNTQGFSIRPGSDEFNDENCVGITYFFPATRPLLCFDNTGPL